MSTRREFIQTSAAVVTLSVFDYAEAQNRAMPPIELYKVIVDEASAPSLQFGKRASQLGLATRNSSSDITSLWYHDLHPRWMHSAAPIAGLTSPESLFCLERLAWDHSMRVLYKATHTALANGQIEHTLTGPAVTVRELAVRYTQNESWTEVTADAVAHFPAARESHVERTIRSTPARVADRLEHALVSWVIGPLAKTTAI